GTGSSRGRSGAAGACARATRLAARAAARSAAQPSRHRLARPDTVLEAMLTLPAAARDARIEAPVGEARLDLLADGDRRGVREQAAVRTPRHDREAARQRGKRTHGIQRALRERQAVRGARYALAHRVQEPRVHSLVPAARRSALRARNWRHAAPSGATSSAAAEGVGARASATKSAMVKSISCPTPDTIGSRLA